MNWNKGFTAQIYVTTVDPATWRDLDRMDIYGGSITRSESTLQESASLDCLDYDQTAERWIRIWMDAEQNGSGAHVALFTGLATSPDRDINGRLFADTVDCYSVLKPAQDVLLPRGWYVPAGASCAEAIAQLLSVTPAPKHINGVSPALKEAYIAEENETHLTMAQKLLTAMDWRIRITGEGEIYIEAKPTAAAVSFDAIENDSIEPKLKVSRDWYECPNVFRATQNDVSAIAMDTDPNSIFSTVSRGREIWKQDSNARTSESESLQAYAERRLKEEQNVVYKASYDRRYNPELTVGDLVRLHYPEQQIDGIFRVANQNIDLTSGGRTSEEAAWEYSR